ncbi:hypothetical protein [Archangium violaceum]|uniref:hypothetical protein n=1 Tax=Archangium violaceum TaxID=83451 RepID=UPI0036D836EA
MDARFSVDALIDLVHRYYPAGIHGDDPRHRASEEFLRLDALRRAAQRDDTAWQRFLRRIREQLPECTVWDLPGLPYDPSRRVRVYLPDSQVPAGEHKAVVMLTSILAPVHLLHASREVELDEERSASQEWFPPLPPEFQPYEATLEALAQESFGSVRLPNDVLFTPVPDLQVGNTGFGKVRLLHCLFTDDLW